MSRDEHDRKVLEDFLGNLPGARDAFALHFRPLIRWTVRKVAGARGRPIGPAETDDLVQEVFVALFENGARRLRQFDSRLGRASSWIALVARQTTIKRLESAPGPVLPPGIPAPPPPSGDPEELSRLREALSALPPREALCLALLIEQELPAPRVADILKVRRQDVYRIRDRALSRLEKVLGKFED